jgi:hypothetical protein
MFLKQLQRKTRQVTTAVQNANKLFSDYSRSDKYHIKKAVFSFERTCDTDRGEFKFSKVSHLTKSNMSDFKFVIVNRLLQRAIKQFNATAQRTLKEGSIHFTKSMSFFIIYNYSILPAAKWPKIMN